MVLTRGDVRQDHRRRLLTFEAPDRIEEDLALRVDLVAEQIVLAAEAGQGVVAHALDLLEGGTLKTSTGEDGDVLGAEALVEQAADDAPDQARLLARVIVEDGSGPEPRQVVGAGEGELGQDRADEPRDVLGRAVIQQRAVADESLSVQRRRARRPGRSDSGPRARARRRPRAGRAAPPRTSPPRNPAPRRRSGCRSASRPTVSRRGLAPPPASPLRPRNPGYPA